MSNLLFKLNSSRIFQFIVITIIILNAITLGVSTYELNAYITNSIKILDYLITIFFVIEILIRFIGEPKKINFFKSGWNIFDTIIVLISPPRSWFFIPATTAEPKDEDTRWPTQPPIKPMKREENNNTNILHVSNSI